MIQARSDDRAPVLSVRELTVTFPTPVGEVAAVNGVSFDVLPGETLAVVGESGSGKSVSMLAALGLVPRPGRVVSGSVHFLGRDLRALNRRQLRTLRGKQVAMVFQDPLTSLNPVFPVGKQLREALRIHRPDLSRQQAHDEAVELLERVGVPEAASRIKQYPHQYSGGMRQRVMIAMAIAHRPALLIADEPTTALDVTIQAQVLEVFARVRAETNAATIMVTHDLGVVAETADRVAVMYGGRVAEIGPVHDVFARPRHPYTAALLLSVPSLSGSISELVPIPGAPPTLAGRPPGCPFHPRCAVRGDRTRCIDEVPELQQAAEGHWTACHFADEVGHAGNPSVGRGSA